MAALTLTKAFINHTLTGEAVSAQCGRDRSHAIDQAGDVRTYGSGRRRSITQAGRAITLGVSLRNVSAVDAATLEGWIGEEVMYRDDRGRAYVVVYFGLDYKEYVDDKARYDVGLTLQAVTSTEVA